MMQENSSNGLESRALRAIVSPRQAILIPCSMLLDVCSNWYAS